jgi:hypothetical protein
VRGRDHLRRQPVFRRQSPDQTGFDEQTSWAADGIGHLWRDPWDHHGGLSVGDSASGSDRSYEDAGTDTCTGDLGDLKDSCAR